MQHKVNIAQNRAFCIPGLNKFVFVREVLQSIKYFRSRSLQNSNAEMTGSNPAAGPWFSLPGASYSLLSDGGR